MMNYNSVAAVILTLAVYGLRKLPGLSAIWKRIPEGARWLVPTLTGVLTGLVPVVAAHGNWHAILSAIVTGLFGISLPAMGAHAMIKDSPIPIDGGPGGKARALAAVALVALAMTGCTAAQLRAVNTALADVAVAIAQGNTILDDVDTVASQVLASEPDVRARVLSKIAVARQALITASDATQGANALTQGDVDKAFAAFRTAWTDLQTELAQDGVTKSAAPKGIATSHAAAPVFELPVPLATHLRIHGS